MILSEQENEYIKEFYNNEPMREAVKRYILWGVLEAGNIDNPFVNWINGVDPSLPAEEYAHQVKAIKTGFDFVKDKFAKMEEEYTIREPKGDKINPAI